MEYRGPEYTDPNTGSKKNSYYLTNFSYLCREDSIGCTPLIDTYNTLNDSDPRASNVWLSGKGGTKLSVQLGIQEISHSCNVPLGKDGCYDDNVNGKKADDECSFSIPSNNPYTSFQYKIFVAPSK